MLTDKHARTEQRFAYVALTSLFVMLVAALSLRHPKNNSALRLRDVALRDWPHSDWGGWFRTIE